MKKNGEMLPPDYFVANNLAITAFCAIGLFYLLPFSLYAPQYIPNTPITEIFLGFMQDYRIFFQFILNISLYIHVAETLVAIALCNRRKLNFPATLKWTLNVAVHGVFSLRYLVSPIVKTKDI